MIVRLIDVVLIILFAFIAISDIALKRQIRLPESADEDKQMEEDPITQVIFIEIDQESAYSIIIDDQMVFRSETPSRLREDLALQVTRFRREGKKPVVIIDPQPDSSVQATIEVYDICEQDGYPKNINMALKENADL